MNIQTIQFIIIIILLIIWKGAVKRSADEQHKISELQNQNTLLNSKYQTESANLKKALKDEKAAVSELTRELDNRNTHFENILKDKSESFPYLAGLMADFLTYDFEVLAKKLDWGADQKREKKVKDIRLIRKEAKERIRIAKEAEYQLEYLKQIYPEIEEIVDCSYDDIKDMSSIEEFKENYDYTASYLSKKEYDELDSKERNQLALDRYIKSRRKSKWQIGRDYELSVGYNLYQKTSNKYSVRYFGNEKRLEDLGRDLIVESHNVIKIVQCKYWSRSKEIHEKHIFQLYGTAVSYKLDNDCEGKEVVPVFVTNIRLSDTAKRIASYLGVEYVEDYPMHDYPRIKCNVGRDSYGFKTKIYHLPFDQQYDNVIIEPQKGECFAFTVEEAENKGFRRAYTWHGKA